MKLFCAYIRERRLDIIMLLLFAAIFVVSFALYRLPIAAIIYPALLCAIACAVFAVVDFLRVRRKHLILDGVQKLCSAMIESLPDIETIDDADYQAIIQNLRAEAADISSNADARYRDMVDYYTVWAHQIKTPITSMRLTLERVDSELSRTLSSDLFGIEQYVEMVLAFLRLGSETSDYVFGEYDLDAIINEAIAKFASEFIARRLRLEYEPVGVKVVTDEKWLLFVIEQVISNALKYTREGSVRIYMREPKTLVIEDTGIGIAPDDLPRVFEKGYTGYNGRRDKRASGIGLYLCRRICGRLGVGINIESEPDRGTRVLIDLEQYELARE